MNKYNKILEKIIRDLQSKVRCPVCNRSFIKEDIQFKGFSNGEYKFEFSCPTCSSLLFAKVTVDKIPNRKRALYISRENQPQKIYRAKYKAPNREITANDIVRLHKTLESEDDISKLF